MKHFLFIILSIFTINSFAQLELSDDNDAAASANSDELYENLAYHVVVEKLTKDLVKNPTDGNALFQMANSHRLNANYKKAEHFYAKAANFSDKPEATLHYAQMLMINRKYDLASDWFNKYAGIAINSGDAKLSKQMAGFATNLQKGVPMSNKYQIAKAPFNSDKLDFSPAYFKEDIVFVSNRNKVTNEDTWTGDNYTDLYMASKNENNLYSAKAKKLKKVNGNLHEGPASFTKDGSKVYFTKSDYKGGKRKYDEIDNTRLNIFSANINEDGKMSKVERLDFNNHEYSSYHPAIDATGKVLYFASDMPGGYGGSDLYMVKGGDDGWGEPVNLGPQINTAGNEVFPNIHGDQLFFASDLHVGYGGLDVFSASKSNDSWGFISNLGAPINSNTDDFGYVLNSSDNAGFFTSTRSGNDDIYSFTKVATYNLGGAVVNCNTGEPIENATVFVYETGETFYTDENGIFQFEVTDNTGNYSVEATKDGYLFGDGCANAGTVSFNDEEPLKLNIVPEAVAANPIAAPNKLKVTCRVINDRYRNPIENAYALVDLPDGKQVDAFTNKQGKFTLLLDKGSDYKINVTKEPFTPEDKMLASASVNEITTKECIIPLKLMADKTPPPLSNDVQIREGDIIELYHIYYDFDKYNIREDAVPDLVVLLNLLRKHPNMRGELGSHTDTRGTDQYNINLSNNRAKAAKNWLISKGVDASRITAKGYGETTPKNQCVNGVECTENQHQRNRRTEFRVTYFDGATLNSNEYSMYKF